MQRQPTPPSSSLMIPTSLLLPLVLAALAAFMLLRLRNAQATMTSRLEDMTRRTDRLERVLREDLSRHRTETLTAVSSLGSALQQQTAEIARLTQAQLESLRTAVDSRLSEIRTDNAAQLDAMRATVDEKLQGTLERRLGDSFRLVADRLELVQRGLGEMQTLAVGVGDLKRVMSNVRARGSYGEIRLEALLDEILAPGQFARNVRTHPASADIVEFAIRLPGRGDIGGEGAQVWLPVDAKFPTEDYERLVTAHESSDAAGIESAARALEQRVRGCARDIRDRYISPPHTTDFGIMFLPTEGLFAEVVRRPGLVESLQRDCNIVVAGPTTFAAVLNALQMGFRTLAMERRSSEVRAVLAGVKTEFGKFSAILDAVKRKLVEATNRMDETGRRSRAIQRQLHSIESMPGDPDHSQRQRYELTEVGDDIPGLDLDCLAPPVP